MSSRGKARKAGKKSCAISQREVITNRNEDGKKCGRKVTKKHCEVVSSQDKGRKAGKKSCAKTYRNVIADRNEDDKNCGRKVTKKHCEVVSSQDKGRKAGKKSCAKSHRKVVVDHNKDGKNLGEKGTKKHHVAVSSRSIGTQCSGNQGAEIHDMSGYSKRNKGPGKRRTQTRLEAYQEIMKNDAISVIRRSCRRIGNPQISKKVLELIPRLKKFFIINVMQRASFLADLSNRKNITSLDIEIAAQWFRRIGF